MKKIYRKVNVMLFQDPLLAVEGIKNLEFLSVRSLSESIDAFQESSYRFGPHESTTILYKLINTIYL